MRRVLSWNSEYVRMTITCPPDIAHPAKGGHLTVSIANYAHHNDDSGGVRALEVCMGVTRRED